MLSKVREVFTKEYREETQYREFMSGMLPKFRLKNTSESIDQKVDRLIEKNYESTCSMKVGKR